MGVHTLAQTTHDDRLEVAHEMAADQGMLEAREHEQPGRLDGAGGEDDHAGGLDVGAAVGVDVVDTGRGAVGDVELGHERLWPQLGSAGQQGSLQRCDRVALGVDGAAVEGAEPAVVARRPAVVGNRVGPRRRSVGVVAEAFGGVRAERRPVHRGAGRHWVGARGRRGVRVGAGVTGHPDEPFGVRVEGLELVVGDGPVGEGRVVDGAVLAAKPEVLLPEPGQLAVGVHAPAADG